jgi:hypothetical protein
MTPRVSRVQVWLDWAMPTVPATGGVVFLLARGAHEGSAWAFFGLLAVLVCLWAVLAVRS